MRAFANSPSDGDQDLASEWSEGDSAAPAGMQVRSRGRLVRLSTLVVVAVGGTTVAFHWRGQLRVAPVQRENLFAVVAEKTETEQVTIETMPHGLGAVAEPDPALPSDDGASADDGAPPDAPPSDGAPRTTPAATATTAASATPPPDSPVAGPDAESSGTSQSALENAKVPFVNGADAFKEAERRPGKGCNNWETITVEHPAVIKSTVEDCAAECRSFPGCTGFQYQDGECDEANDGDIGQKGTCYIWKGLCDEMENSCVENFKTVPYTFALWAIDSPRTKCGNAATKIREEGAFNANVCGQRCAEDDLCNFFAYGGDSQCALFKGTTQDCEPADDVAWDLYVMDRVNDIFHDQAKHANERDEAVASGAGEPAQGIVDPEAVITKLTNVASSGEEEIAVEDASGFHDDDVLFIKGSGADGRSEHNKVKAVISGEAGNVLKLVEKLKHTYHTESTEVELVKKTAR